MALFNVTGQIGVILDAGTQSLTGNIVATLLLILILLIAICLLFGIELEYTAIILLPICMAMGAYYSTFMGPIIVILIYISTLIAKNWIFR